MTAASVGAKRYLTEGGAVALAVVTWAGAAVARPVPVLLALAVLAAAFVWRRPVLLIAGCGLLACSLGAASRSGLVPVEEGSYRGSLLLVTDPTDAAGAVRADAKLDDGRRVEVWGRGGVAHSLADALAGERMEGRGSLEPPPDEAEWLAVRHVVGRLNLESVTSAPRSNDPAAMVANLYRRTLVTGSFALPSEQRALFLGFVLGDDRGQDPAIVDDFRGSGLSHLLVVSGQNVAFLLVLAQPLLRRLAMPGRFAVTIGLLLWFATLTRFEPSVLRATAMATVSAIAVLRGVRASAIRGLALAVTALLLVDPLLQASVGFRLSVGASAGIVLLAGPIGAALPGPRTAREALGVTLGAQAGVAPVLVSSFGGVPAASLIANVLAVPAAGPIMMWGLTSGWVAGLIGPVAGGWVSRAVHLPTRALLWWVAEVARVGATAPLGQFTLPTVVMAGAMLGGFVLCRGEAHRRLRRVFGVMFVASLLVPAVTLRATSSASIGVASGATLWRRGDGVVLVVGDARARPTDVLEGLRRRGIGRVDLYVSASGGRTAVVLLETVRSRVDVVEVWQPVNGSLTGAQVPASGQTTSVGALEVRVDANEPRLTATVREVDDTS